MSTNLLVIGVGNPHRRDDAVGLSAVRRMDGVDTAEVSDCSELIDLWDGRDEVIVIDATLSDARPGTIRRIDAIDSPFPDIAFTSTHAFDLGTAISMSKLLGRLPASLTIYGIEADDISSGAGLTPSVQSALESVLAELGEYL
jgi:hydrogenase maturation protease